ncbi:hypothetical protein FA15DRAFT_603118 [Coprinopsis marcescibilis]|uniref:Fungal pheromone STE3G-protein-coupled receptor n=1 Tax=Coprinopsis marcescibilis TaxID=230819 RepID=A0A5C3KFK5_COPMA|nr:hypothetical protein FA15DRAFT_603118 [Coprinopsis marcescibilis]
MNSYALMVFFETPSERRQGRALYLISGWLIFTSYTIGASSDMAGIFQLLLEASNGLEYLWINTFNSFWMDTLSVISFCLVFIIGEGLLLYRCYLLLAGSWRWLLTLPGLMYLSVIGKYSMTGGRIHFELGETMNGVVISLDILTFLTNLFITSILCYRLLSSHRDLARLMPLAGRHLLVYQTATRILIESALPLTIAGIINAAIAFTIYPTYNGSTTGYAGDPKALFVAHACVAAVYYALQVCIIASF